MKSLFFFMFFLLGFAASANGLYSANQILSFNCSLNSAAGFTQLNFDRAQDEKKISGKRNAIVHVSYQIESAGRYGNSQKSHITMSGGSLARNQYLSLMFNTLLPTGKIRASGSIMLMTMGGSVFAPALVSSMVVGTVSCASIVIK